MNGLVPLLFSKFCEGTTMYPGRFVRQCGSLLLLTYAFSSIGLMAGQPDPTVEATESNGSKEPTENSDARPTDSQTEPPPPATETDRQLPVGRLLLRLLGVPVDPRSANQDESGTSQRDPFETTRRMREAAQALQPQGDAQRGRPTLPELRLRGTAQSSDRPTVAILEVGEQGTVVVREGEAIGLPGGGPVAELTVTRITHGAVHVQRPGLGQTMVVR